MDTAWTWDLSSYCAKYSFLTEPRGVTMREVERIFQLDPEPPIWGNLNDYILEAVQRHNLRWFSFFLHCYGYCQELCAKSVCRLRLNEVSQQ